MRHTTHAGLGVGLATILLIGGCTAGAAGPTEPAAPSPSPEATMTLFTGRLACREDDSASPPAGEPDAVMGVCEQTATDSRLSGTSTGPSHFELDGDAVTMWSTTTLSNAGGTWSCREFGFGREGFGDFRGIGSTDSICTGQGGYEGLTAYSHGTTGDSSRTWSLFGWIEKAP